MGIRETLNRKPALVARITTVVILFAVVVAVWYAVPRKQHPAGSLRFFSDDDGNSWFADDYNRVPPFMHDGKEAVFAKVYQQGSDGKPFVAYLEKYTDEARQKVVENRQKGPPKPGAMTAKGEPSRSSGLLVKKPHQGAWVDEQSPDGIEIRRITAPDGNKDYLPMSPE